MFKNIIKIARSIRVSAPINKRVAISVPRQHLSTINSIITPAQRQMNKPLFNIRRAFSTEEKPATPAPDADAETTTPVSNFVNTESEVDAFGNEKVVIYEMDEEGVDLLKKIKFRSLLTMVACPLIGTGILTYAGIGFGSVSLSVMFLFAAFLAFARFASTANRPTKITLSWPDKTTEVTEKLNQSLHYGNSTDLIDGNFTNPLEYNTKYGFFAMQDIKIDQTSFIEALDLWRNLENPDFPETVTINLLNERAIQFDATVPSFYYSKMQKLIPKVFPFISAETINTAQGLNMEQVAYYTAADTMPLPIHPKYCKNIDAMNQYIFICHLNSRRIQLNKKAELDKKNLSTLTPENEEKN